MNNSFHGAETLTGSKGMKTREQVTTWNLPRDTERIHEINQWKYSRWLEYARIGEYANTTKLSVTDTSD
jgi:hypothetical protein